MPEPDERLATAPPEAVPDPDAKGIPAGLRYARSRPELIGTYLIDMAATSGPLLGNAEAGAAASLVGVQASVVSGGVLCVLAVAATAAALPAFWRFDDRTAVRT